MTDLNLPADLVEFLRAGKQLEYDPTKCEAGAITLLPLDRLRVEFFPMMCDSPKDPHAGDMGCYLVKGVNLVASCDDYDPAGLLLWLPLEERYALWDSSHDHISVFGPKVNWQRIAKDPARHINAHWGEKGSAPVSDFTPWVRHSYNPEQVHHPLPELEEWYEAGWVRRGEYRNAVQLRYPEEIRIRVERDGGRCEVTAQVKEAEETATWSPAVRRTLAPDEWQQIQPWLEAGFWDESVKDGSDHEGETATMWSLSGFRAGRYRSVFRSFDEVSSEGDAVHELGKHLAGLAKLQRFEAGRRPGGGRKPQNRRPSL